MKDNLRLTVETDKHYLSSKYRVYKTETFLKQTAHLEELDAFLYRLGEAVFLQKPSGTVFSLATEDGVHTVSFVFGAAVLDAASQIKPQDMVFFNYHTKEETKRRRDNRLAQLLQGDQFSVLLSPRVLDCQKEDFRKLYRLSSSDLVNFPLLNETQKRLVQTEDRHMIAHGVAGSGKTNICIDKIVFAASREYQGRVLYTTYSRGLLVDTQEKIGKFVLNLVAFVRAYQNGQVVFLDEDHKRAIEGRLGIYFSVEDDERILQKIERVVAFLKERVDYFLMEDLYRALGNAEKKLEDENGFAKSFLPNIKNHQLKNRLQKLKHHATEILYKEVYGLLLGSAKSAGSGAVMPLQEYIEKRKTSFSRYECEVLHELAKEYLAYLAAANKTDNNQMSRELLSKKESLPLYALAVVDEVQDFTEMNLVLLSQIARKLLCVGDALQMINPAYFSFAFLKRLLFHEETATLAELSHNYRNSKRIAEIVEKLSEMNRKLFGTHSFVLHGASVEADNPASAIYTEGKGLIKRLAEEPFHNYTVVVATQKEKRMLRQTLDKHEILTVSEIKGLERETVLVYNVLSSNKDKWARLARDTVNKKEADENSVYRYYFNLFYVAISRAKTFCLVAEDERVPLFAPFFANEFDCLTGEAAAKELVDTSDRLELLQEEMLTRIQEFIKAGQFDNARFHANNIQNPSIQQEEHNRIAVHEQFVWRGAYHDAGIAFWEFGMLKEAKEMFLLANDDDLVALVDAVGAGDAGGLNIDIVRHLPAVMAQPVALRLITEVMKKDRQKLEQKNQEQKQWLKERKR